MCFHGLCNTFLFFTSYIMNPSEQKNLLKRLSNLDNEAFADIYDGFVDKIYRFVYFKVSSVQEAEDITSEVFLKVWEYARKGEGNIKHLSAFLYQIARNLVIDYYRKSKERKILSLEDLEERHQPLIEQDHKAEVAVSQRLAGQEIEQYLKKVSDPYREALVLKYLDGYSVKEIALILGKQRIAVRVLLHRALKALSVIADKDNPRNSQKI